MTKTWKVLGCQRFLVLQFVIYSTRTDTGSHLEPVEWRSYRYLVSEGCTSGGRGIKYNINLSCKEIKRHQGLTDSQAGRALMLLLNSSRLMLEIIIFSQASDCHHPAFNYVYCRQHHGNRLTNQASYIISDIVVLCSFTHSHLSQC